MGLIKRWFIKRALNKPSSKSDMEQIADDVLKNAMQELNQTSRTSKKLLQAKLIRQESRHALDEINSLDEDLQGDEEPAEEAPSMEENVGNALLMKLLGGGVGAAPAPQQQGEPTGYDDEGNPVYPAAPQAAPQQNAGLGSIIDKLSPTDIEALKKKFL